MSRWLIGLTGGYASGKSMVAEMLRQHGATILDADHYARQVVSPGSRGLDAVKARFGSGIITLDGTLDRAGLASIIFADADRRKELESILHPLIRQRLFDEADLIRKNDHDRMMIVMAPLLFEGGLYKEMQKTVLVTCSLQQQIERGMSRDGFSAAEIKLRMAAQWTTDQKRQLTDMEIDNSGDLKKTRAAVSDLFVMLSST